MVNMRVSNVTVLPPQRMSGWSWSRPLLAGDTGTGETIARMREAVWLGLSDPGMHALTAKVLQGVPGYNDVAAVQAIYQFILSNVRFTNDDPTVLNRDIDALLLKLTAQAGTVLNKRARENSAEKIRRLLFMFITPAFNLVKVCIIRSFLKFFCYKLAFFIH